MLPTDPLNPAPKSPGPWFSLPLNDISALNKKIAEASQHVFTTIAIILRQSGQLLVVVVQVLVDFSSKILKEALIISVIAGGILIPMKIFYPPELFLDASISTVLGPVLEEIVFRGALLSGAKLLQQGYNQIRRWTHHQHNPSEAELKAQEIFRVRVVAITFGFLHLWNRDRLNLRAVFHVCSCTLGGLSYGYLKEKTNSLALPIIAHCSTNLILTIGPDFLENLNPSLPFFYLYSSCIFATHFANKWYWYKYATATPPQIPSC